MITNLVVKFLQNRLAKSKEKEIAEYADYLQRQVGFDSDGNYKISAEHARSMAEAAYEKAMQPE